MAAHRYADFWQVTGDALGFATTKLKLRLPPNDRTRLMNAYLELKAWPEVIPVLESPKASGLTLALLSNFTPTMLGANIKSAGLGGIFERVLSTDDAETFKRDPRAYQLGVDAIRLKRDEILFVAFAGWDAAGAKMFWISDVLGQSTGPSPRSNGHSAGRHRRDVNGSPCILVGGAPGIFGRLSTYHRRIMQTKRTTSSFERWSLVSRAVAS